MSSRKRSAGTSGATPVASKQPRVEDGASPPTATRPHGRVVLDVGGQHFVSSRSTLEGSSSYFQALLARWDEESNGEPLFIDCDADAFGVLLSHMRIASNLILPDDNEKLCARVLLLAEYLGMDDFLAKVKAKAYKNMHPEAESTAYNDAAAAFDAEVGSLQEAIDNKVLPARYFAPAPKPPAPPPERIVKSLIPAPVGTTAMFTDGRFGIGGAVDDDGDATHNEVLGVHSFAVVELPDGSTRVEAVVQRTLESTRDDDFGSILDDDAYPQLRNHLKFASEYGGYAHHLIIPPPCGANLLPVAPGTIRAVWAKPAITRADVGKKLTVSESGAIIVNGEVRAVTWGDRRIPKMTDVKIGTFFECYDEFVQSQFRLGGPGGEYIQVPYLTGLGNQVTKDVAFVEMGRSENGILPAKFYIADSLGPMEDVFHANRLVDVRKVGMHDDGMQFSHTVTATMSTAV